MIAVPAGVYICDECVDICADIIEEEYEEEIDDDPEPQEPEISKITRTLEGIRGSFVKFFTTPEEDDDEEDEDDK